MRTFSLGHILFHGIHLPSTTFTWYGGVSSMVNFSSLTNIEEIKLYDALQSIALSSFP